MILNEPQIWMFLSAVRGHEHEALYDLAIKTGMREGELLGLKWNDTGPVPWHAHNTTPGEAHSQKRAGTEAAENQKQPRRRTVHLR